jgi:hypothetical protein
MLSHQTVMSLDRLYGCAGWPLVLVEANYSQFQQGRSNVLSLVTQMFIFVNNYLDKL